MYKTAGTTRVPLPLALPKLCEALTELERIDALACCDISTLYCEFEILTKFKFRIPFARFATICSIWGAIPICHLCAIRAFRMDLAIISVC